MYFCYVWMPSSTQDLIFLLPVSVISLLIGVAINGCLHYKGIVIWLLVTGLVPALLCHHICSWIISLYIPLSWSESLDNFSFFSIWKEAFSITSWTSISLISSCSIFTAPLCRYCHWGFFTPVGPDLEVPFKFQSFALYSFTCCHSALFISCC